MNLSLSLRLKYCLTFCFLLATVFVFAQKAKPKAKAHKEPPFNMSAHFQGNSGLNNEDFVRNFPFKEYLQRTAFSDVSTIHEHRYFLNQQRSVSNGASSMLGDDFVYNLGENFLRLYPVMGSLSQLNAKISIGEKFLNFKTANYRDGEMYRIIGYFLLGKVARRIENDMKSGSFDISQTANKAVVDRLGKNKIYLTIEKKTMDKLKDEIAKGNIGYVFDRMKKSWDEWTSSSKKSNLKQNTFTHKKSNFVDIYRLNDEKEAIGYTIWLQKTDIKAGYLASNAFTKYKQTRNNRSLVLATTGGFTNVNRQPEGLTVENGNIINAVLMPERHGLVIVENGGALTVSNLKNQISIPNSGMTLNPLDNLLDYSRLINWCKANRATVFQTQLLAHNDAQLISLNKAANQLRERRLLCLVRDNKTGLSYNVIVHVTANRNLAIITEEVFDMMKSRNCSVEAILNLDVGSYDILKVFDANSKELGTVKGKIEISKATNLIYFYKQ